MSDILQSIPSPMKIREELERMVFADLHGPVGGEAEEIDEPSVRERYLVGMLAPKRQELSPEEFDELPQGGTGTVEGTPMPCPACGHRVNLFDAAGIDLDAYDFSRTRYEFRCPARGAELEQVVPFIATGHLWHWQIKPSWLREQLRKAQAFDRRAQEEP